MYWPLKGGDSMIKSVLSPFNFNLFVVIHAWISTMQRSIICFLLDETEGFIKK